MTTFRQQLLPNEYVDSVCKIDLDKLWQDGRRVILSDLDNTLVPWNHPDVPQALAQWYETIQARGFQLCIVSNNRGPRVMDFAAKLGIQAIGAARKPRRQAFEEAMQRFHVTPKETVMVGDQLLTDVRGGNRCGLYTILVVPINNQEWWGTKLNRVIERFTIRTLLRTEQHLRPHGRRETQFKHSEQEEAPKNRG